MTKKEIVKTISEDLGLTQHESKEIVRKTLQAIVDTLVEVGRVELRNFGIFKIERRAPRKARNPRTGEYIYVPEKFVVTFKPGKQLEERVQQVDEQALSLIAEEEFEDFDSNHYPVSAGTAAVAPVGNNGKRTHNS